MKTSLADDGNSGCIRCWIPHIPLLVSDDQGGNCLGSVRMCGHLPLRPRSVTVDAAARRRVISAGV